MKIINKIKEKFRRLGKKDKAVKQALQCKGWPSKEKLSLLFDLAQQTAKLDGDILEIGSAWGRSTVLLALATTKKIWSIDPHTGGVAYIKRGEDQGSFVEFKENLKKNKVANRVNLLCSTTAAVVKNNLMQQDVRFSMVFIDGLHTAEGVKVDFDFAFSRLNISGIMVFDDYFEPTVPDYIEMINLLMAKYSLNLTKDINSRLVYCSKTNMNVLHDFTQTQHLSQEPSGRYQVLDIGFHGDKHLINVINYIIGNCVYFIETGTNVGSTLRFVAKQFKNVMCFSCEPDKAAYEYALQNIDEDNVKIFNEGTKDFLDRLMDSYSEVFDQNVVFWLDAHGCGFDWPLKYEIEFITNKFKKAFIFIDDFKVPGCEVFGYDSYNGQECSFEYIKDSLNPDLTYNIYYPTYTEKTSLFHPLRGWCLVHYGAERLNLPQELVHIVSCYTYGFKIL